MNRFTDKGEDSKIVARLIERLREAIVCYQVGNNCAPALSIVDTRRVDIATTGNPPANHSSHSRSSRLVPEIDGDQPVSQDVIRYPFEAEGGNPL